MPTPADLWNFVLPDPYPNAQPKSAAVLLGWACAHASLAREQAIEARAEAAAARAAVTELARQFAESDFDDEALITRMRETVRLAMAEVVHVDIDVTVNDTTGSTDATGTTEGSTPTAEYGTPAAKNRPDEHYS